MLPSPSCTSAWPCSAVLSRSWVGNLPHFPLRWFQPSRSLLLSADGLPPALWGREALGATPCASPVPPPVYSPIPCVHLHGEVDRSSPLRRQPRLGSLPSFTCPSPGPSCSSCLADPPGLCEYPRTTLTSECPFWKKEVWALAPSTPTFPHDSLISPHHPSLQKPPAPSFPDLL